MRPSFAPAVLFAVAAMAALALGLGRPALAEPATAHASCGTFVGPAWTWLDMFAGTTKKGNTWAVTARRVPCAYAKKTAKTLVKTPFRGEALTRIKAPKGWSCIADGGASAGGRGTPGHCTQGSKFFQWRPATGS